MIELARRVSGMVSGSISSSCAFHSAAIASASARVGACEERRAGVLTARPSRRIANPPSPASACAPSTCASCKNVAVAASAPTAAPPRSGRSALERRSPRRYRASHFFRAEPARQVSPTPAVSLSSACAAACATPLVVQGSGRRRQSLRQVGRSIKLSLFNGLLTEIDNFHKDFINIFGRLWLSCIAGEAALFGPLL